MTELAVLCALFGLYLYYEYQDALLTSESYSKGGVEGNGLITMIFRTNKPTLKQLVTFNILEFSVLFMPLEVLYRLYKSPALGGFALAVDLGMPIGAYLAVRKWRKWYRS